MTSNKKLIHIAKHRETGAEIPVEIRKVNSNNVIEEYAEHTLDRKGYTLAMLQERWKVSREAVLEILKEYKVPAHLKHANITMLERGKLPVDAATFFEEYIHAIEEKTQMTHTKIKSKQIK